MRFQQSFCGGAGILGYRAGMTTGAIKTAMEGYPTAEEAALAFEQALPAGSAYFVAQVHRGFRYGVDARSLIDEVIESIEDTHGAEIANMMADRLQDADLLSLERKMTQALEQFLVTRGVTSPMVTIHEVEQRVKLAEVEIEETEGD